MNLPGIPKVTSQQVPWQSSQDNRIIGSLRPLVAQSKATKEQQLLSVCFLLRHSKAHKQKGHRVWAKPGKGEWCSAFPAVLGGNFVETETWEDAQEVP